MDWEYQIDQIRGKIKDFIAFMDDGDGMDRVKENLYRTMKGKLEELDAMMVSLKSEIDDLQTDFDDANHLIAEG